MSDHRCEDLDLSMMADIAPNTRALVSGVLAPDERVQHDPVSCREDGVGQS